MIPDSNILKSYGLITEMQCDCKLSESSPLINNSMRIDTRDSTYPTIKSILDLESDKKLEYLQKVAWFSNWNEAILEIDSKGTSYKVPTIVANINNKNINFPMLATLAVYTINASWAWRNRNDIYPRDFFPPIVFNISNATFSCPNFESEITTQIFCEMNVGVRCILALDTTATHISSFLKGRAKSKELSVFAFTRLNALANFTVSTYDTLLPEDMKSSDNLTYE